MPILVLMIQGDNSYDRAEGLARELLKSGAVRGAVPPKSMDSETWIEFLEMEPGAISRILDEAKSWATSKGLTAIAGTGIWTKITLGFPSQAGERAEILLIA